MTEDFTVRGADEFLRLSKALKAAGRGDLRKELNKRIRTAAKPVIKQVREAMRSEYPQSGGFAQRAARKSARISTATGSDPGVKVVFAKQDPRLDSEGRLVHPVFGRAGTKVVQQVTPGVASRAFQAAAPEVRDEIEQAIESVANDIVRGV